MTSFDLSPRFSAFARCLSTAFILLSTASAVQAETWLFDMGTAESELRPGFRRVTAESLYSAETGYGWESVEGFKAHHQHYSRQWQFNESRGQKQPPPFYTNEITCDAIFSTRPARFLIDVEPGEYVVYALAGRSAGSPREYHWFDISAGGARATIKIPGPYRFENRTLPVAVEGKQLAIELEPTTDWLLAALAVFPAADAPRVRAEVLDALEREIYFLPPDVAAEWKETVHDDPRQPPEFSQRDLERGYALFARHWSEPIYPRTVPRPEELNPQLAAFASWDEYEPLAFTVHALDDLRGVKVAAGPLQQGDAVIEARDIDVRYVRYMHVRPNYSLFNSYHIAPDVLEHRNAVDVPAGAIQTFWITVHVPPETPPGVYEGMLSLSAEGRPAADVPLRLRVLPIRLEANPDHIYGMYYHDPLSSVADGNTPEANAYFQRKADLERQDMVAHGMNCHISSVSGLKRGDDGQWTVDGAETERRIALDRKYGLAGRPLVVSFPVGWQYEKLVDPRGLGSHLRLVRPDVPQAFFDEVTRMVEAIERERKARGWPEFLYYPIDEPSTAEDSVHFMVGVLKAIKRVPGVRTYVTADPSHEQFAPMWPYVDVWCCQPFVFDHDRIRSLSREKQIEFWCYPNHIAGENDHTPVCGARMTWGFGFWRSGFKALIPWIYQANMGDPWNYLDSTAMDFMNRSTPDGEPIPVALWEAYREGIDDGRYLYTLQQLSAKARARGGKLAELADAADREIQFIWNSIDVQEKYKDDGLWAGADFDAFRWLLAEKIIELQTAIDQ